MTSKPDDQLDVLEILESQHAEVDELIEQIESGDADRVALFEDLADKLAAHATCEEKIFYPGVMEKPTSELLHEAVEDHLSVRRLLADMLELDPNDDDDEFDAKITVLKEMISHHAHQEEEGKLFPIVRKLRSPDELAALGNEYLAMFESVIAESPRNEVSEQTDEAAPLPPV